MNKILTISLLATIAICSCQKQESDYQVSESKIFTASIEDNNDTKTSLNGENVLWTKGDLVSVFDGSTINHQYKVKDAADGKSIAELELVAAGSGESSKIDNNVAFYPYSSKISISKGEANYKITDIDIPSTQDYLANSFGNGSFPMVAVTNSTSDLSLKFKNIFGGLKLQLKGTATIKSISVEGNNNEILCGTAEVTASNENDPSISLTGESSKVVTLDCGEGVALNSETVTSFIIALPPKIMNTGFTVTILDTKDGHMELKTEKSKTISRSSILKMAGFTYIPEPKGSVDLGLSVKWASCNLGASKPWEYGRYFAWGDVVGQTWNGSTWSGAGFSKAPSYELDANNNLKPEYDAAHVKLGGNWRMPTIAEFDELYQNCTYEWTTVGGVYGRLFTSKKAGYTDKSIFLPAAGYGADAGRSDVSFCYYWSSSFDGNALNFVNNLGRMYKDWQMRYVGEPIRPVLCTSGQPTEKVTETDDEEW